MQKRILVVDDEADSAELIQFNLSRAGFEVAVASNAATALQYSMVSLPDLIVLDLLLPDADGFAVCELLRKDPRTARIPVLMLTAFSSRDAQEIGIEAGASDYLVKPFSPRLLVLRIRQLFEQQADTFAAKLASVREN